MNLRTASFRLDAGVSLPGEGRLQIAADLIAPEQPKALLVCLPGGGMSRRYYDLLPPDGREDFSFARQLARRGFACVLIDHIGIGESTRPVDGYALTADVLAAANGHVTTELIERLRTGTAVAGLPALPELKSIGVGHSMGAMLTIVQQDRLHQHAGVVVLGFATRGLPEYLPAEFRQLDSAGQRKELQRLARSIFREPYPNLGRTEVGANLYSGKTADPAGVEAIKAARDRLLPVPAVLSMLPNNVAAEAARIDVPVFVGLGEHDMTGPPLDAPKAFTGSPAVTFCLLPGAGHSHFLFPARTQLFDQIAVWAGAL